MFLFCKSIIFSGDCSKSLPPLQSSVKTRFKAFWDIFSKICMRPWIRSLSNILPKRPLRDDFLAQNAIVSAQKPPAGRFSGSKYNFVYPKGRLSDLRNIKKYVSWYLFGFDICNLKLFAIKNRLGIVPSLQNIQIIKF